MSLFFASIAHLSATLDALAAASRRTVTGAQDSGLPDLPKDGVSKPEDTKGIAGRIVLEPGVNSALGPEKYAFTKATVRRNIYRVWVE